MEENDYRMWHRFFRCCYIFYPVTLPRVVATVAADVATGSPPLDKETLYSAIEKAGIPKNLDTLTRLSTVYEVQQWHIVAVQMRLFHLRRPYFPLFGRSVISDFYPREMKKA